jgi:hypothetical protein
MEQQQCCQIQEQELQPKGSLQALSNHMSNQCCPTCMNIPAGTRRYCGAAGGGALEALGPAQVAPSGYREYDHSMCLQVGSAGSMLKTAEVYIAAGWVPCPVAGVDCTPLPTQRLFTRVIIGNISQLLMGARTEEGKNTIG